ncbi:hypothetical protein B484DRAFT_455590 [Ochromonadaceae sp. CCMP2298]|nr:hypothetical protein B484DRAFT_455590 [Ochromonadaceae sp. CCMP2298]
MGVGGAPLAPLSSSANRWLAIILVRARYHASRSASVLNRKSMPPPRTKVTDRQQPMFSFNCSPVTSSTSTLYLSGGPATTLMMSRMLASLCLFSLVLYSDRFSVFEFRFIHTNFASYTDLLENFWSTVEPWKTCEVKSKSGASSSCSCSSGLLDFCADCTSLPQLSSFISSYVSSQQGRQQPILATDY